MTTLTNTTNGLPRRHSAQLQFIESKTVADVLAEVKTGAARQLVDLPSTATMEEALRVLLAEDILSVPVYRLDNGAKTYLAIVSVLDLLKVLNVWIAS